MKILTIANKKEEKFLRTKTADFDFSAEGGSASGGKKYNKEELQKIIDEMKKTMEAAPGIGLSANQIGLNLRLFGAKLPEGTGTFYAIFNPKIKISPFKRKKVKMEEGCLSVPGVYGMVERPEKVTLIGRDINGKKIKIKAQRLLARVFQHEVDHLNGILFIDKTKEIYEIPKNDL